MDPLSEEKNIISGKDFALDIAEKAMAFMKSLEEHYDDSEEKLYENAKEIINEFNKEVLYIIQKLPIDVLGTLFHQMIIDKCLDPDCTIEISGKKINVFLSKQGRVQ
jgi:glycine/serine hydroxymethyltransferase